MPNIEKDDPSLARDIASAGTAEDRFDCLVGHVSKLAIEVHTLKGNLAANTSLTKEVADGLIDMRDGQAQIKATQEAGRADTAELLEIFRTTKAGVKFIVWFGSAIKWGAGLTAAVVGAWYAFRNGSGQ